MKIQLNHAVALVIDMQERLFPLIHQNAEVERACIKLIKGLRILNVPILLTQQYTKGLGATIPSIAEAMGPHDVHEKTTFSCCGNSAVEAAVLGKGHSIIVMGIEAHVCVQQTVLDVIGQGRKAIVVEDCVSSRFANDKKIAIKRMRSIGATITTVESLLFELLESSQHPSFKAISALVK